MGGGREGITRKKAKSDTKADRKRITSDSEKCQVLFITQYPERLHPHPFNMPRLGFVRRQCSLTRQRVPTAQFTPASILCSTPFTRLCQLWHRTPLPANSAAYMGQNTKFCFILTSRQFSAELVSLSSSEITSQRITKAATRRWLKYSTGRKKVEGESFLYLHFLEQIIKLPLMLWQLQPQSIFSKTLEIRHMWSS